MVAFGESLVAGHGHGRTVRMIPASPSLPRTTQSTRRHHEAGLCTGYPRVFEARLFAYGCPQSKLFSSTPFTMDIDNSWNSLIAWAKENGMKVDQDSLLVRRRATGGEYFPVAIALQPYRIFHLASGRGLILTRNVSVRSCLLSREL